MSRADAIAHCKRTAGALVVFDDSPWDATGTAMVVIRPKAIDAEWEATRSALQRAGVRIYIRGPLCYGLWPDSCRPTARPEPTPEVRHGVQLIEAPLIPTPATQPPVVSP